MYLNMPGYTIYRDLDERKPAQRKEKERKGKNDRTRPENKGKASIKKNDRASSKKDSALSIEVGGQKKVLLVAGLLSKWSHCVLVPFGTCATAQCK
jgi:hypothetical protein